VSEEEKGAEQAQYIGLHNLKPEPGSKHARRRVGRGHGSGHGKTSGRGHKGFNSRAGGGVRPGYEGGQMPLYMRVSKLRGPNKKMSMPMGPFRTHTIPVNVGSLAMFPAGSVVDSDALEQAGLVKNNANRGWPIKILGDGEIDVALTVRADAFSASAREKIEDAGGTAELITPADSVEPAQASDRAGDEPAAADAPSTDADDTADAPISDNGGDEAG